MLKKKTHRVYPNDEVILCGTVIQRQMYRKYAKRHFLTIQNNQPGCFLDKKKELSASGVRGKLKW